MSRHVAAAFVPAAHVTPPTLVYIARSTTICAGVRAEAFDQRAEARVRGLWGSRPPTGTFVRLFGCERVGARRFAAAFEQHRHARLAGERRRVGDQDVGLRAARAADFTLGQRPARARRRRARRVVRFVPRAVRPPHRPLDDHRHVVHRHQLHRHRRRRQQRLAVEQLGVDVDRRARVGADVVGLLKRDAVRQHVGGLHARRRVVRIGDQDEQIEERAGRAFGQEPVAWTRR